MLAMRMTTFRASRKAVQGAQDVNGVGHGGMGRIFPRVPSRRFRPVPSESGGSQGGSPHLFPLLNLNKVVFPVADRTIEIPRVARSRCSG